MHRLRLVAPFLALCLWILPNASSATSTALVIAIDTSGSIDATEFDLQRKAYANFSVTTPAVSRARTSP